MHLIYLYKNYSQAIKKDDNNEDYIAFVYVFLWYMFRSQAPLEFASFAEFYMCTHYY